MSGLYVLKRTMFSCLPYLKEWLNKISICVMSYLFIPHGSSAPFILEEFSPPDKTNDYKVWYFSLERINLLNFRVYFSAFSYSGILHIFIRCAVLAFSCFRLEYGRIFFFFVFSSIKVHIKTSLATALPHNWLKFLKGWFNDCQLALQRWWLYIIKRLMHTPVKRGFLALFPT